MESLLLVRGVLVKRDLSDGAIAGTVVGVVVAACLLAFCLYPVIVHQLKRRRHVQRPPLDTEAGTFAGPGDLPPEDPEAQRRLSSSDSLKHGAGLVHGDLITSRGGTLGRTSEDGPDPKPNGTRQSTIDPLQRSDDGQNPGITQFALYHGEYMPESLENEDDQPGVLTGTSADYYSRSIPSEAFGMITTPDVPDEPASNQIKSPSRGSSLRHNVRQLFRRKTGDLSQGSFDSANITSDRSLTGDSYVSRATPLQPIITNVPHIESPTELSPVKPTHTSSSELHTPTPPITSLSPNSQRGPTKTPPHSPYSERGLRASPSPPAQPAPGTVNPMDIMPASTESEMWHRTEHQLFATSYGSSLGVPSSPEQQQSEHIAMVSPLSLNSETDVSPPQIMHSDHLEGGNTTLEDVTEQDEDISMEDAQRAYLDPTAVTENGRHPSYPSEISTPHPGPSSTNPSSQSTPSTQIDSPSPESLGSSDFRHSASPQTGLGLPSPRNGIYRCDEPGCSQVFDQPHKLKHHQRYHSKDHKCPYSGCGKGFGTKTHLQRHINDRHEKKKKFHCAVQGCDYSRAGGKAFPRKDNWKRHMTKIHNMDQQNLPEPIEVDQDMGGT